MPFTFVRDFLLLTVLAPSPQTTRSRVAKRLSSAFGISEFSLGELMLRIRAVYLVANRVSRFSFLACGSEQGSGMKLPRAEDEYGARKKAGGRKSTSIKFRLYRRYGFSGCLVKFLFHRTSFFAFTVPCFCGLCVADVFCVTTRYWQAARTTTFTLVCCSARDPPTAGGRSGESRREHST